MDLPVASLSSVSPCCLAELRTPSSLLWCHPPGWKLNAWCHSLSSPDCEPFLSIAPKTGSAHLALQSRTQAQISVGLSEEIIRFKMVMLPSLIREPFIYIISLLSSAHLCQECFSLLLDAGTRPPLPLHLLLQSAPLLLQGLQLGLHAQDVLLQVRFLRSNPLQLALLLKELFIPSTCRTYYNCSTCVFIHKPGSAIRFQQSEFTTTFTENIL